MSVIALPKEGNTYDASVPFNALRKVSFIFQKWLPFLSLRVGKVKTTLEYCTL
jgi:hypothetical protein